MPTSSRTAFFVSVLAAAMFSTMLPACGRGPLVCTGGARVVGSACYCAKGQTWNGSQCAGTPETGACAQKNSMEVVGAAGSICYCPDGWIWDSANRTECLPCTGGAIANGDSNCYCPDGTAWNNNACEPIPQAAPVASCMGGAIATDQGCVCPQGASWDGAQCMCPAGAEWNGAQCVWAQQQQPQQQVIQQRSIQSSSSFTCCINHAKYNCPNDAAFQACATMRGNHGCSRAGGC